MAGLRTPAQAVQYALYRARPGYDYYSNLCDRFVGNCYGLPHSGYASATSHWHNIPSRYKHTGTPPLGGLPFWAIGSNGHVAISVGGGRIASNDIVARGYVSVVPLSRISSDWGAHYVGWADPYFSGKFALITKPTPAPTPIPPPAPLLGITLHLHLLQLGLHNSDVLEYQRVIRTKYGLASVNPSGATGFYGSETATMTERYYRYVLRVSTGDLRVPGPALLRHLGFTYAL